MVHHICQNAVGHRTHRIPGGPASADKDIFIEELVKVRDEMDAQFGVEDVASSYQ